jgi:DNA-binding NarL/FixJ family response regulator
MPKTRVCRSLHETTRGNHRWPSRIGDDPTVDVGRRETTRPQISVLISDSTKMHCDLLRKAFYSVRNRFQVVAFASSTVEVLAALQLNRPQVAVISSDLQDGPLSGVRMLPEIRSRYPETKILVVTASPNKEVVIDAFRFGAVGVFSRNDPFDLLCKAIEAVSQGQIWAASEELHYVLRAFAKSPKPPKLDPAVESRVTVREAAVVRLAIEGLSNREIAQKLALTEHTVKNYLFRVFDKLGVSNRVELVLACLHQEENAREELAAKKGLIARKVLPVRRTVSSPAAG